MRKKRILAFGITIMLAILLAFEGQQFLTLNL